MAEEGSGTRVVRNTLLNGLGTFTGVGISLVLTPFLIKGLGIEAFGVWALALSFSFLGGYAAVADLGVEAAVARYIAEARAARDDAAGSQIASTALAFFTAVALVATPLLALAGIPLTSLFGVDGDLLPEARLCFALVAGQLLFELPARSFLASLEGVQRYGLYQVVELSRALTQAALIIVVLVADLGIAGMGGAVMLSSLVVLAVAFVLTRRTVPEIRVAPRYVSREAMRKLVSFGSQFFFVRVMATIYRQIDKAIISIAMGPRFVTGYEVANRIHQGAAMVQSIASSALLPATAFHHASRQVLRDLFLRGTNYTVALSLPVAVAAMIFADDLIRTWIGDFMVDSADAARIFLVFLILAVFQTVGGAMLVALGDMRFVIAATVVFSVANLGLSIALVGPLGVNGVILGLVIAQALVEPAFVLRFMRRFEVGIGEILRATVMPNIPGVVAQLVTAVPLVYLADRSDRLWEVGLILIASVGLSLATFLRIGLGAGQRVVLTATLRSAAGLKPREMEAAGAGLEVP